MIDTDSYVNPQRSSRGFTWNTRPLSLSCEDLDTRSRDHVMYRRSDRSGA